MNGERFAELAGRYSELRVALVGDFCLDRYLEIDPARAETSIETGLEVFNVARVRSQPGGCGTILNNLSALGAGTVFPVGFAGEDGEGYELMHALGQAGCVDLGHFFQTRERRTFSYTKPLVMEPGRSPKELNRLDFKNWSPTPKPVQEQIASSLYALAKQVDVMVLLEQVDEADTGVLAGGVLEALNQIRHDHPELLILADSRRGPAHFPSVGLKMNREEFTGLTGESADMPLAELCAAIGRLAAERGQAVFVSLSEDGIAGARPGEAPEHVPCQPLRGEIDIVGAGDSVMANLAMALAAGAGTSEAMTLAMAAASVVVHQLGTTGTASQQDIRPLVCAY
ncbi:MAG: PfkB family carbohydrate kinase [Verrucomicrobiota bacterium]|nr:PfkB family carbohydrate kinase [Verrucomicrobiota bacterium]MDP6250575.1 PfkB family carbohydrate kinase [Verrucomicrobiota bacterium]